MTLDELKLLTINDNQDHRSEVRAVGKFEIKTGRKIVSHRVPNAYGIIIGDIGRYATKIFVSGSITGDDAEKGAKELMDRFKKKQPLELVSDLSLLYGISKVLIQQIMITKLSSLQNTYHYKITLFEYQDI